MKCHTGASQNPFQSPWLEKCSLSVVEQMTVTNTALLSSFMTFQLNPNVNAFQRKFVGEIRRCEELEKTFSEY